jgi:DNA repair protein RadC
MLLDSQHKVLECNVIFSGTIDGASIYPREIVKAALYANAAAVILAHNHPSGQPEPSTADKRITERIKSALALVDIRVLDHIIVGDICYSFAQSGEL